MRADDLAGPVDVIEHPIRPDGPRHPDHFSPDEDIGADGNGLAHDITHSTVDHTTITSGIGPVTRSHTHCSVTIRSQVISTPPVSVARSGAPVERPSDPDCGLLRGVFGATRQALKLTLRLVSFRSYLSDRCTASTKIIDYFNLFFMVVV
jgi:hypothetical protein